MANETSSTEHWHAGWNMPGYSPDNPPDVFDTREGAVSHLADAIVREVEDSYQAVEDTDLILSEEVVVVTEFSEDEQVALSDELLHDRSAAIARVAALFGTAGDMYIHTCSGREYDLGYAYFVHSCDDPECLEELED